MVFNVVFTLFLVIIVIQRCFHVVLAYYCDSMIFNVVFTLFLLIISIIWCLTCTSLSFSVELQARRFVSFSHLFCLSFPYLYFASFFLFLA